MSHDARAANPGGPAGVARSETARGLSAWLFKGDYPRVLIGIFLLAFALRVLHASNHDFTGDERPKMELAESIRLNLSDPHLVFTSAGHPLLIVYMAHLSAFLFGTSLLGYRLVMVIMGSLMCLVFFRVGKALDSTTTGLWAALLVAVDQFHVTLSGSLNSHDLPLVLFGTLALLACSRLKPGGGWGGYAWLGLWMGLAYLGKETALLLLPALWGFMLVSRDRRAVLKDPRWYFAHLVALLLVAPDVIWNLSHLRDGGYVSVAVGKATRGDGGLQIQAKALSLFIGEVFMMFDPGVFGGPVDYWGWPLRTMYWVAGALYLGCAVWALRFRGRPLAAALLCAFWVTMVVVTLIPGDRFDPFWWASLASSPAILFTALRFTEWSRRFPAVTSVLGLLVAWFLARTLLTVQAVPYSVDLVR